MSNAYEEELCNDAALDGKMGGWNGRRGGLAVGLGGRLRERRDRAGLTQAAAARAVRVPRELISMWETEARVPGLRQLEELARLYRASVGYLLGEEELDEKKERESLYGELVRGAGARLEVERWLDFLEGWAGFLEDVGEELPGPSRPPRSLDEGRIVADARRAPKLAAVVREYYWLDLSTVPVDLYAFFEEADVALVYRASLGDIGRGSDGVSGAFYNHPKLGYSILVNADTAPGRQVFTLAHEFAHALFHYPISVLEWVRWAVEEEELSHAQAANLLDVDIVTFRHQIGLLEDPPEATEEEEREFDEFPPRVA